MWIDALITPNWTSKGTRRILIFSAIHDSDLFQDVFGNFPIPYPKREFLTDDDNEDKSDSKLRSDRTGGNVSRYQA